MKMVLILSVLLNIALTGLLLFTGLEGCAEIANGRLGTLSRDIEVGQFDSGKVIFMLPKGLVVREASATGAGWFEPHRFRLVITSQDETYVDYSTKIQPRLEQHGELYSADVRARQSLNAGSQSHDR